MPDIIVLSDRIKETSNDTGTDNLVLDGAAVGFSAFGEFYSHSDAVYYAITDGTHYEVGSGQYMDASDPSYSDNQLIRFPFRSKGPGVTLPTDKVNWPVGVKEIYVTYPATYSVYTASGLDPAYKQPQASGLAFWESPNILNYDPSIIWDATNNRLGLNTDAPAYTIDVGGDGIESQIRSSGVVVGTSGVLFPSGYPDPAYDIAYPGGKQFEHFVRNEIDTYTGADEVILLSGVVDQKFRFKEQTKGHIFAGPPSGCGCADTYPSFRYLTLDDIPDLSTLYVTEYGHTTGHGDGAPSAGYVTIWKDDNVITFNSDLFFNTGDSSLGIGTTTPVYNLDVVGDGRFSSSLHVGGSLYVKGNTTYVDSNNVTIWDKHLELASMSGNRVYTDSLVDGAGIIIKSSGDGSSAIDGDKKWVWMDATDAWTTDQKIDVSGVVGDMFDLGTSPAQGVQLHDTIWVSGVSGVETSLEQIGTNHVLWVKATELSGILSSGMADATSAGSGLISYADGSFNLNVPSGSYANMTAAAADLDEDQVLVWDSGSHIFKYMSLGQLQSKIDTTAGGASTWDTIDVNDAQGAYSSWGTSNVSTTAAGEALHLVAGDHMSLSSSEEDAESAVRFTNTGTPVVSGMVAIVSGVAIFNSGELVLTSGILQGTINNLSGQVSTVAGSGLIEYADSSMNLNDPDTSYSAITASTADKAADQILLWDNSESTWGHMTLTELQTEIDTTGGGTDYSFKTIDINDADTGSWGTGDVIANATADTLKLIAGSGIELGSRDSTTNEIRIYNTGMGYVSGILYSASGTLNEKINNAISPTGMQSGISVFNDDYNLVDTYAGGSGMFWDSGNVSLSIGNVSDTVSSLFIDTVSGVRRGLIIQASDPQDQNLFEIRGSDGNISGIYIDGKGDFVGTDAIGRGGAEFFAGREAGYLASDCGFSNMIGRQAGYEATGCTYTNMMGHQAGSDSTVCQYANMMGYQAGYNASGCNHTDMIGASAGVRATGCSSTNMIGLLAGYQASGCTYTNMIGAYVGYNASGCGHTNMIGRYAGEVAYNCSSTNMIGLYAGSRATGCDYTNMIGSLAGYRASGCSYTQMIGRYVGRDATDCNYTNMIGWYAGYTATGCDYTNMIGALAGYQAKALESSTLIGWKAGISYPYSTVEGVCSGVDNVYIGTNAGLGHAGEHNISLISSTTDEFHPDKNAAGGEEGYHSHRMNLGNTIFGITAGTDTLTADHSMRRMIQVGEMPERNGADDGIGATLAIKPYNGATDQPTMWLKRNVSQSAPVLMSHTQVDYTPHLRGEHTTPESQTFAHINHNGVLCIPIFDDADARDTAIPEDDNNGAIAFIGRTLYVVKEGQWIINRAHPTNT